MELSRHTARPNTAGASSRAVRVPVIIYGSKSLIPGIDDKVYQ